MVDTTKEPLREAISGAGPAAGAPWPAFAAPELLEALEGAGVGVFRLDLATGDLVASPSLTRLLGLAPGTRPTLSLLRRICHPEDRPLLRRWTLNRHLPRIGTLRGDCRIMVAGGLRWLHVRGSSVGGALAGVAIDATESREAEAAARALAARREARIQDLHHRIKNNLQLVSSLLRLQAARGGDDRLRRQLDRACQRLVAIAEVHGSLQDGEDGARLDFGAYLETLCRRLAAAFPGPEGSAIEIAVTAGPCLVEVERALPLALIANELVVNALKHAFKGVSDGRVQVGLECRQTGWTFFVADTGSGPPPVAPGGQQGVGMLMVESFAQQLGGTLRLGREGGFRVDLDLPAGP